ncbi:MAG: M67 family metallopeptidase [Spirochaetia bacterium]
MSIRDEIVRQAETELPNECCGYLAGIRSGLDITVSKRFPMTNVDESSEHFAFDPNEQFTAIKAARAEGLDLVANYHSHPETPARLSTEDIRLANDTSSVYLIYSVVDGKLKAFTVDGSRAVTEERMVLTE